MNNEGCIGVIVVLAIITWGAYSDWGVGGIVGVILIGGFFAYAFLTNFNKKQ